MYRYVGIRVSNAVARITVTAVKLCSCPTPSQLFQLPLLYAITYIQVCICAYVCELKQYIATLLPFTGHSNCVACASHCSVKRFHTSTLDRLCHWFVTATLRSLKHTRVKLIDFDVPQRYGVALAHHNYNITMSSTTVYFYFKIKLNVYV